MGVLLASVAMEAGVIGPRMFVALVVASIVSALAVGPAFAWRLRRREVHDVSNYFSREEFVFRLEVDTRLEAIGVLAAEAAGARGMPDAEVIREAVTAREKEAGTGVGRGIAIPHARLDLLPRPLVVVGISPEGIEWDEVDGKPAHLVFLILTSAADDSDIQLEILAKIARAFSPAGVRRRLIDGEDANTAWACLQEALQRDE